MSSLRIEGRSKRQQSLSSIHLVGTKSLPRTQVKEAKVRDDMQLLAFKETACVPEPFTSLADSVQVKLKICQIVKHQPVIRARIKHIHLSFSHSWRSEWKGHFQEGLLSHEVQKWRLLNFKLLR